MSKKNNVRPWLLKRLKERGQSVSHFTLLTQNRITTATIFRWFNDTHRPTEKTMRLVCDTLSTTPLTDGTFKKVPLAEGMAQFKSRIRRQGVRGKFGNRG
jgi:hypothetical protein